MAERQVSVIVPIWNGLADTLECLRSLMDHDFPNLDVILVDNGSRDGTPARVREEFPEVYPIENERNLGFARACNMGSKRAVDHGANFLLFLTNDATIEPTCIRELLAVAEGEKGVSIVGVLAYHASDPSKVEAGHRINWWTAKIESVAIPPGSPRALNVDYVWGCRLLVSSDQFKLLDCSLTAPS